MLSKKTGKELSISYVDIGFLSGVSLNNIFIEDANNDTLLFAENINVEINLFSAIFGDISPSSIELENIVAKIKQDKDSVFNFDYLINSFSKPENEAKKNENTETNLEINLNNLKLDIKNTKFIFYSETSGINLNVDAGNLNLITDSLDIAKLIFSTKNIYVSNTRVDLDIFKDTESVDNDTSEMQEIFLDAERLDFNNISFYFNSVPSEIKLVADVKSGYIIPKTIDILNGKYFAQDAKLDGANVSLEFYGDYIAENIEDTNSFDLIELVPDVGVETGTEKIELSNGSFKMDYTDIADTSRYFDVNHMFFKDLSLKAENAEYLKNEMHANISAVQGTVKNEKITVESFSTNAKIRNNQMQFSDIKLATNKSRFNGSLDISYNKFNDLISDSIKFNKMQLSIDTSFVDIADINYFFDTDSIINIDSIANTKIALNSYVYGNTDSLIVEKFNLKIFNNSHLITSGKLKNIDKTKNLTYNFDIKTFNIAKDDFTVLTNDTSLNKIDYLVAKGNVNGSANAINTKLNLLSNFGEMNLDIAVKDTNYTADIAFVNENFSQLFKDTIQFENFYAKIKIKGKGFDYKTNTMDISMQIDSLKYNKENLTNLLINLNAENGKYTSFVESKNENIYLKSDMSFELKDSVLDFYTQTNITKLDLQWLANLNKRAIISFELNTNYSGKTTDSLSANINLKNFNFLYDKEYIIDELNSEIYISDELTDIKINSDYINGFVKSNFNIAETEKRFYSFIAEYFQKNDSVEIYNSQVSFSFDINDENIVNRNLIEDLNSLNTRTIKGNFDAKKHVFNLDAELSQFAYKEIVGDSVGLKFFTKNDLINYKMELNKVNLLDSFFVDKFIFSGYINRDSLTFEFNNFEDNYSKYYFGASLVKIDSISRINLYPKIIIDSVLFDVNADNFIEFGKDYLKFGEISVINNEQKILIKPSIENGDIDIEINNFDIALLSKNNFIANNMFAGIFNMKMKMNIAGDGDINAEIKNLDIYDVNIGNIVFKTKLSKWKYDLMSELKGEYVDVSFTGNNNKHIEIKSEINKLDLQLLKAFTANYFKEISGKINGGFNLQYSKKLKFDGNISFNKVRFKSKIRDASLIIDNQELSFSNKLVKFDNFTIKDSVNNKFIMNGKLYDLDYNYFKADLKLDANNFTFYDANSEVNKRFFGKIILNTNSKIVGDIDKLEIVSDIKFIKGTKLTYVFPENELMSMEKTDGIVEFITKEQDSLIDKDTVVDNWINNVVLKSNIIVDKNTELNIIFNDIAGESISLVGGANVNFDIDEGGTISLNGDYIIEDGKYNLSYYEIVKREFNLKKASHIIWTGDPYNPIADIVASYQIKTNPYPLMVTEGSFDTELNKYRINQTFYVNLSIQGMMLYPEMSFNIEYPKMYGNSNDQALQSKINMINSDPVKVNKQAISLLLISSFVTDDGYLVNGGETFVNNSVSSILTSQLNKYSNKFVKGVDFNFDVNRYSTYNNASSNADGAQTDVKIQVKKSLFNDRIVVKLAGGVSMESKTNSNENSSIHDAAIEYLITKDGRYKLRAFSEKDYSTMEQDVQSSGLSFIYTAEFDKLNELFGKEVDAKKEEENEK